MRLVPLLVLVLLSATPAAAAATPWQEVFPGVRLRFIADDVRRPDGTTMVGLEIDMPANTKTYWRVPGESGIPTEFDLSGSHGIAGETTLWPYPQIDRAAGLLDFVYYGPTVLPLALHVGDGPAEVNAAVTLGICSDVCVPAMAKFSLPLALLKADAAQQIRLEQAVALTPLPWTGPPEALGPVSLAASGDGLVVSLSDPGIDPASVIADMGPAGPLFGAPQKSPDGKLVVLPLLGGSDRGLEGRPVQLTFLTSAGAYETSRVIGSAGALAASP